jgi:hypothetical protein
MWHYARGTAYAIRNIYSMVAAPYFAHALLSPSATVLALPDPGDGAQRP